MMLFIVSIGKAQTSDMNSNQTNSTVGGDSLVDIFPLALGNQWTYQYVYSGYDGIRSYADTSIITMKIIDKIVNNDSIQWFIEESGIDTIEIVELLQGNHKLRLLKNCFFWWDKHSCLSFLIQI